MRGDTTSKRSTSPVRARSCRATGFTHSAYLQPEVGCARGKIASSQVPPPRSGTGLRPQARRTEWLTTATSPNTRSAGAQHPRVPNLAARSPSGGRLLAPSQEQISTFLTPRDGSCARSRRCVHLAVVRGEGREELGGLIFEMSPGHARLQPPGCARAEAEVKRSGPCVDFLGPEPNAWCPEARAGAPCADEWLSVGAASEARAWTIGLSRVWRVAGARTRRSPPVSCPRRVVEGPHRPSHHLRRLRARFG